MAARSRSIVNLARNDTSELRKDRAKLAKLASTRIMQTSFKADWT